MSDINTEFKAMVGVKTAQETLEAEVKDANAGDGGAVAEGEEKVEESGDQETPPADASQDGDESVEGEDEAEESAEGAEEGEEAEGKAGDARDDTIRDLKARLAALEAKDAQKEEAPEPVAVEVADDDYESAMDSKEKFAEILSRVATDARDKAVEGVLKQVPSMIAKEVETAIAIKEGVREFWKSNADLASHRARIGLITSEVQKAHPEWDMDKILSETEKKARKELKKPRLVVKKKEAKTEVVEKGKPAFAKTGGRTEMKKVGKLQSEFELMTGKRKAV